ncbi:MAG: TonB-dependent siderophore receptor [Blastocatellia bacterium]|nr:TonB-dependent siderophore receptor [Blastocatellia bacterium]
MKVNARKCGKKGRARRKHKAGFKPRGPRYWMAMSTMSALLAYTPIGSKSVQAATAGSSSGSAWELIYPQDSGPSKQLSRFDIPPGPLGAVLATYQNLTGLRLIFPSSDISGISSPGVSGALTAEKALEQLLAGTGVVYRFTGPQLVTLELKGVEGSVEILGRITPSSPKYTEPLRDTPQTINVIPRAVIEEQGATTLRDVLRNVPGLTVVAGEGGAPAGDNLMLRGFSARNDIFVDGVRDISPQTRDAFNLEQVEVVKGPGSAFTGRGSTGGSVNLVTKTPNLKSLYAGSLSFGTDGTKRVTTDVNLPFKDRYAFRLNLMGTDAGVAGRDVTKNQRWGIAPSLSTGLGTSSRFTFNYLHVKQDNIPDYGIPWVPETNNALSELRGRPAPVDRANFYGIKSRDYEVINADVATVNYERDFSDNMTVRNQLRYGRTTRDSLTTAPRFASDDSLVISRNGPSWLTEDKIWDNQTDLKSRFDTGSVGHNLVTGLSFSYESNQRLTRAVSTAPTTDLYHPDPDLPFNSVTSLSPYVGDITGKSMAFYAFDTAKLGRRWELVGGLRWDYFDADGVPTAAATAAPPARIARIDRMLSGRGSIVFKPRAEGSVYASYGTSIDPSLEGLAYQPASANIEPEKTYTVEVGTKWDLVGERLSLNGAVFNVDKTNARTTDPVTNLVSLDGDLRVRGFEIGASGSLTRLWKVLAGYTLLDSRVTKSNNPQQVGRRFQNTPRNSFNIWTTYLLRSKFNLGGGVRFIGKRFGNLTNTRYVDKYYTIDALASFPINNKIEIRLNLYNLNNAYYFDRLGDGHVVPGAGRSAMLSTGFRF